MHVFPGKNKRHSTQATMLSCPREWKRASYGRCFLYWWDLKTWLAAFPPCPTISEIRPAGKSECHENIAANQIRRPHTQMHPHAICPSTRHLHIANCSNICAIPELHRHNNRDAAAEVVRVDGLAAITRHVLAPPESTIPRLETRQFVSITPWRAIPPDPCIHFGAFLGHRHSKHKHLSLLPTSAAMLAEGIQRQSWDVVKDRVPAPCENCQASNGHPMCALKNRGGGCPSASQSSRKQNMRCLGRIHASPRQMGASAHGYWNSGALLDVPDHIAQQHRCEFVPEATVKI